MKFKIHYNGEYEDSLVVEGDTITEIAEKAEAEADKRGWNTADCWSEQIEEQGVTEYWCYKFEYVFTL